MEGNAVAVQKKVRKSTKGVPKKRAFMPIAGGSQRKMKGTVAKLRAPGLRTDGTVKVASKVAKFYTHNTVKGGKKVHLSRPRPIFKKASGLTCADKKFTPAVNSATGKVKCIRKSAGKAALAQRRGASKTETTEDRLKFVAEKKIPDWKKQGNKNKSSIRKGINWLRFNSKTQKDKISSEKYQKIWAKFEERKGDGMAEKQNIYFALKAGVRA
jgi:hypothetical protein